jgi:predicted O-methyltransferase YrrM
LNKDKPYSRIRIAWKYLKYYFGAASKHKVHSPFVYDFFVEVIGKTRASRNKGVEQERARLLRSKQVIDFKDYGKNGNVFRKTVSEIAKKSLKKRAHARLITQTAKFYEAENILELGTSLGITTAYLAGLKNTKVVTLEGDENVSQIAKGIWGQLGYENVISLVGDFDSNLDNIPDVQYDMIFIDGNHKYEPTLRYFKELLKKSTEKTIFIFDDIHYGKGMENAWAEIKKMPEVTITLDLFFLGYVFIDPTLTKQDFILKL